MLYQTGEYQKQVYESIRDKMIKHSWKYTHPIVPIAGEIRGYLIKDTRKSPQKCNIYINDNETSNEI